MKTPQKLLSFLAGAVLLAASNLNAAMTEPVGYVTETLRPATFNLLGFNLANPTVASGEINSVVGTTVTDTEADFTSAMSAGNEYYIKITNGTTELGLNTGVTASSATSITTDDDLSSAIGEGTTYDIRRVLTVSDLFGENNDLELQGASAGDISNADIIWIPDGLGGYTRVYYNATSSTFPPLGVGWKTVLTGNDDASTTPVYFTGGVFIEVKRSSFASSEEGVKAEDLTRKNLVFSGSVHTEDSQVILESGFNLISRVFPSDVTLGESKLELDIATATAGDTSNADIVWIPDGSGGYNRYYYNATASTFPPLSVGWKGVLTGDADKSGEVLTSGLFIQRKSGAKMVTLRIPETVTF